MGKMEGVSQGGTKEGGSATSVVVQLGEALKQALHDPCLSTETVLSSFSSGPPRPNWPRLSARKRLHEGRSARRLAAESAHTKGKRLP